MSPGSEQVQQGHSRWRTAVVSLSGALGVLAAVLVLGIVGAVFSGTSPNPGNVYTADQLNAYLPSTATASRTASGTCLVSWTPVSNPPAGVTYDITDGSGATVASGVSGTSRSITVPATAVTPTVKVRLGTWVSSSATPTNPPCYGYPDSPVVTLTPSDNAIAASWPAPSSNGGTISAYTATISPTPGSGSATCLVAPPTTSCSWASLANGVTYTVSVTATSNVGTGAAGTGSAIPYPSTVMSSSALQAWYDAAMPSTMLATNCSGSVATTTVACWKDRSGKGNDVSGGVAPGLSSTAFPGRSVPSFTGTQFLTRSSGFPTSADYSEFVVYLLTSSSCNNNLVSSDTSSGHAFWAPNGNRLALYHSGSEVSAVGYGATPGTAYIGSATYVESGRSAVVAVNGSVAGTGVVTSSNVNAGIQLGAWGGGYKLCGQLAEVVVLNQALTASERRSVEDYLSRKWSVTITPGQPTAVAGTAGDQQSTLTWTAPYDGGSPITAYTATAVPSDGALATVTRSCASSPCTVTGLTNGVTYTVTVSAVSAVGTSVASAAVTVMPQPALLTSADVVLWLDGRDVDGDGSSEGSAENCGYGVSCASLANALRRWVDKSGGGRDAIQTTTAMAPTYTPATGLVTFSGAGYQQTQTGVPTGPGVTAFAVVSSTPSTFNTYGWFIGGRAANGWLMSPNQGTSGVTLYGVTSAGYSATTLGADAPSPPSAITNPHVWDGQITGGTSSQTLDMAVDGAVGSPVSITSSRAAANVVLTIGADDWDLVNRRGQGSYREVVVFKTALTAAERTSIRSYLARKWSTAVVPGAPTGVSATPSTTANGTATVSWTAPASNGGAAISSYTVTATSADSTAATVSQTCSSSPCSVGGFSDGAMYTVAVAATNIVGTGAASAGSSVMTYPAAVMSASALSLWMDGADVSTLVTAANCNGATATSGTTIGCWKDKSSQANNANQSSAGRQPTVSTLNGRTAPLFDGTDDYYPLIANKLPTGTTPSTIWVVAAQEDPTPAASGYRHLIGWGAAAGGQARVLEKASGSSNVLLETFGTWPNVTPTKTWPVGTAVVTDGVVTATTFTSNVNGASNYVGTATNNTGTSAGAALGSTGWNLAAVWWGRIGEVIVTGTAATTAETRIVQEYLARKWGIGITPSAPSGVTVTGADSQASVAWTSPWNGGSSITGYTVTATPVDSSLTQVTKACASSPCTVTGLTNGATYSFDVTATNAAGTSARSSPVSASAFPALLASANLKVWLDAQYAPALSAASDCTGSGVASGVVGCWKDRSGNGWNAVAAPGASGPTLTATAVNGRPALTFSTSAPTMYQVTASGVGAVGSADRSLFAVGVGRTTKTATASGNAGVVAAFNSSWTGGLLAKATAGTNTVNWLQSDTYEQASTPTGAYAGGTITSGNPFLASAVLSSSGGTLTNSVALDGAGTPTTAAVSGSWMSYGDSLAIGSRDPVITNSMAYPLDGDVGEVLVFNRALTAAERRTVEEYLARHWGQIIAPRAPALSSVTKPVSGQLTATWGGPSWDGGSTVTGYVATAAASGQTSRTCTTSTLTCTISGLTPGVAYTVSVVAQNTVGAGPASNTLAGVP